VRLAEFTNKGAEQTMSPTPEASERHRKAAYKAWETIRRKAVEKVKVKSETSEIVEIAEAKEAASDIVETADARAAKFSLERDLQNALRANIEQLESGLAINDGGKEKTGFSRGRTDILAIDANKKAVVIELKAVIADRDAISQILQYMGDLQEVIGGPVRGIVIAPGFTVRAIAASKPVPGIELRKYGFNFTFTKI
jgi:RecB family endonuclease NucS